MRNFLEETVSKITAHGHSPADVQFVKHRNNYCSWEEFAEVASFEYNPGFGSNEIDLSLKVVGVDWWLERHEYDGSEWWEYKSTPQKPDIHQPLTKDDILDILSLWR